jgi:hypothetical protein
VEPTRAPILAASATATAGAATCMLVAPGEARAARRLAIGGVVAEGALMQTVGRRLGDEGSSKLSWAAKGMSTTGAALLATRGRRSRAAAALGGALVCAGEMCLRRMLREDRPRSPRDRRRASA